MALAPTAPEFLEVELAILIASGSNSSLKAEDGILNEFPYALPEASHETLVELMS